MKRENDELISDELDVKFVKSCLEGACAGVELSPLVRAAAELRAKRLRRHRWAPRVMGLAASVAAVLFVCVQFIQPAYRSTSSNQMSALIELFGMADEADELTIPLATDDYLLAWQESGLFD